MIRHASLFSGIGGFDLAAEWMGWENVFHCEWMEFPRKILDYYWPDAESFTDITKTNFTKYENKIDILTGGFPCQPFSTAGKRKGKDDERYLWGDMLRAIQEIKPKFVIAENVYGITNIDGGLVFEQVCLDLEAEGYEVQAFIIPAAAKNAPHRRDRVWFVAYNKSNGLKKQWQKIDKWEKYKQERGSVWDKFTTNGKKPNASNTDSDGQYRGHSKYEEQPSEGGQYALNDIEQNNIKYTKSFRQKHALENKELERGRFGKSNKRNLWESFPSQSPICGGDDGLPTKLDTITFSKWRAESIKGYGNAIVPQVAFEIFKQLIPNNEAVSINKD